ncbi:dGTP triphosphohydrolase [Desulfosporosinus lacus]|uniref:dGTPase n=1 Tax=Desulfosporosinus lacus DSM 15449 TaxID=1121420 RepID=A0A1M5X771_9FIRM|nr:dNTP triphosphohydrolase [Desulfosporosinus lacus]SHH95639.1 dGTPase [Desulfosporosinus lacus DSM 15449]
MNDNIIEKNFPNESLILEKIANSLIANYGFRHKEEESHQEETYRTEIRRQRDKILYTGGFRRLQDKTQVMSATLTGDHRTRLTHTLEVEQIAVSVADALGLNKDLVSAIALGHDVGHTPFGHAAERTLNRLLKDNGGFHHPIQSAKYLWEKYGNNLIDEIYEGILVHDSDMFTINKENAKNQLQWSEYCKKEPPYTSEKCLYFEKFLNKVPSTLEAQAVIWADKIAYITHDLDDFLHSPIYTSVVKSEGRSNTIESELCKILGNLTGESLPGITAFESRDLIRAITTDLILASSNNIKGIDCLEQEMVQKKTEERLNPEETNDKKRYLNSLIINFNNSFRNNYYELRELLNEKYIFSPEVQRSDAKAQKIVSSLYTEFVENYKLLPLEFRIKIDDEIRKIAKELLTLNVMSEEDINDIMSKKLKEIELILKNKCYDDYEKTKAKIITRIVASYISTMSDTYAENIFCNLNASKDNYSL